jgi:hypothetical protein
VPLKESSEKMRERMEGIRGEIKGVVTNLTQAAPRPIFEKITQRQTMVLREPILKTLRSKRK